MTSARKIMLGGCLLVLVGGLWVGQSRLQGTVAAQMQAPLFEVDPFWPQPLPENCSSGTRSASGSTTRTSSGWSTGARPR